MFKTDLNKPEQGFASIVIALTMIVVLTIMTVGFVAITSREQQQALDKYLATQANYTSESGINSVVYALKNSAPTVTDQSTCKPALPTINTFLDYSTNSVGASVTCVFIDRSLPNIYYQNVSAGDGRSAVFDIGATPLNKLTFKWTSSAATSIPASATVGLLPATTWAAQGYPSLLQVDFVPLGSGNTDRQTLLNNEFHVFFYPTTSASSSIAYSTTATSQGQLLAAHCVVKTCDSSIASIGGVANGKYLVHFINYYGVTDVSINANNGTANINGAQAQIDVTGKARNVLKRIQVRAAINSNDVPNYGLEAQSICKRMHTIPSPGITSFYTINDGNSPIADLNTPDPCNLEL